MATAAVKESAAGLVGYSVAGFGASATNKNLKHLVAESLVPASFTTVSQSKDSCMKTAETFGPATVSVCHTARYYAATPPR